MSFDPSPIAHADVSQRQPLSRPGIAADALFGPAIESLPNGVLIAAPGGLIAFVNRELERQFGYVRAELIGQSVDLLLPEGLRNRERRGERATGPEPRPAAGGRELFGRRKDGSRFPVEIRVDGIETRAGVFVVAAVVDVSESRRLRDEHQRALEEAIQFDHLVGDLSATFVNLPAEQADAAIENAQRRILEALDLDRSALFQFVDGDRDLVLTHHRTRAGLPEPAVPVSGMTEFRGSLPQILAGATVCSSSLDEIPDDVERESVRSSGAISRVAFPLAIDGRIAGAISFSSSRTTHPWSSDVLGRLHLVAQVFGAVLARKQADAALRASEQRFRTLADNAPALVWTGGLDKARSWFNRRWLEFVGQSLEHELGHGWTDHVHPDDASAAMEAYGRCFDERAPFTIEYRLRRQDGEFRWILDNGAPDYAADGTFAGYLGSCIDITEQKHAAQAADQLREALQAENLYLRREVKDRLGAGVIVGQSDAIRGVLSQIEQVANTDATVLLLGETGTGKELFATRIHDLSARRSRAMVRVNCSAIPATLIESELFGREKGAFTGALARQVGRFELADHSTIFLDEIGDLPADVQVKLLRVLEERVFERLGSPRAIRVDTRIIAATHRNLERRIGEGSFREDLFYRLNVFPIHVPPLRERSDDIPLLVWRFVDEFSNAFGKRINAIPRENMTALQQYSWPGNIRELRNVVERAMIMAKGPRLTIPVPKSSSDAARHSTRLADIEKEHIRTVLETSGWRIRGTGGAADRLGLRPTTLETRMAKLGLTRPKPLPAVSS